jgi:type II secretory ATPase GspE/PulE/Tfp pilus assembly ATPase PilB-like protein
MRIPVDILEDAIRFRKSLAGEMELSESVGSSWNSNLIRMKCEICGLSESRDLEVHHIKERHLASSSGHLKDLTNVHSKANLVVLCDKCHDKTHEGSIEIGTMIQTSDGMERSVITTASESPKKSKWSQEDLNEIKASYTKFPKLSMPALAKYLLNQHSIQISVPTLKKLVV